jgi:RNA polymerase sigma-70 factor (ECF subfamily)
VIAPSLGSRVAHAAVVGRTDSPATALTLLDALPAEREQFQPYHATRGELLARLGRRDEAAAAYVHAAALSEDPVVRSYLDQRRAGLSAALAEG